VLLHGEKSVVGALWTELSQARHPFHLECLGVWVGGWAIGPPARVDVCGTDGIEGEDDPSTP